MSDIQERRRCAPTASTLTHLPFIDDQSCWSVKASGNYGADCLTGNAYALDALRWLATNPSEPLLPWVVMDMPAAEKWTGIETGFLQTLSQFALSGADRGVV